MFLITSLLVGCTSKQQIPENLNTIFTLHLRINKSGFK
jgi:uncharacterized protein YcfL